jgi:hypothetical protein
MSEPYKHDDKRGARDWAAQEAAQLHKDFGTRFDSATEDAIARHLREAYAAGLGDAAALLDRRGDILNEAVKYTKGVSSGYLLHDLAASIRALAQKERGDG